MKNLPSHKNLLFVFLFGILTSGGMRAQTIEEQGYYFVLPMVIENGDSIGLVDLSTISIYPRRDLSRQTRFNIRYIKFARKVRRAYPYARLAVEILNNIYDTIPQIESDRQRRRFLRAYDKALRDKYMDELKQLTVTEGRILLKLIDRETGKTSFYLVEELRGHLSALFWQSLARIFGENLKTSYDPTKGIDRIIEEIVVKIETGRLETLPPRKKEKK
jgi:hypothetical protein